MPLAHFCHISIEIYGWRKVKKKKSNSFSWLPEALWFGSLGWLELFADAILVVARRYKILFCSQYPHWIVLLSLHNRKLFWKPVQSFNTRFCIIFSMFAFVILHLFCFLKQSKLLPTIISLKGLPKAGRKTVVTHSTFYVHMFYHILFGKYVWRCFRGGGRVRGLQNM